MEEHQNTPGLRYSQVIVNHGRQAGASVAHPHGQLLGIPFVPRELTDEQAGFARFAGGCLLCATAASEERVAPPPEGLLSGALRTWSLARKLTRCRYAAVQSSTRKPPGICVNALSRVTSTASLP